MFSINEARTEVVGPKGTLAVKPNDEVMKNLLMLIEGRCTALGPKRAAAKYGLSKARFYQLFHQYEEQGAAGLRGKKRGPKSNYRRTPSVVREVVQHRYLDREAPAKVISQKMNQTGKKISIRSVQRVITDFGLQKKTLHAHARDRARRNTSNHDPAQK